MHFITTRKTLPKVFRRYTTFEIYRASALNFFKRGVDGLSIFNHDHRSTSQRIAMTEGLKRITDVEYLKTMSKNYVIYPNSMITSSTFPATDEKMFNIFIADDTSKVKFKRSVLRIETKEICSDLQIGVWLNGKRLEHCETQDTELFPPPERNVALPSRETLKFYSVPLELIIPGVNQINVKNFDQERASSTFISLEFALYKGSGAN